MPSKQNSIQIYVIIALTAVLLILAVRLLLLHRELQEIKKEFAPKDVEEIVEEKSFAGELTIIIDDFESYSREMLLEYFTSIQRSTEAGFKILDGLLEWSKSIQGGVSFNPEIIDLKRTENFRKEFLGNISHELKTPIFIAQSYIETLLDGSIDDKEVNRKHLKKSLSSIVRLSTIVNELEMISKLERDIGDLPKEVFNINALICEVLDSLDIKIKKENVFINKDSIANKKCLVVANKDKIEQVVYNLLENALK